MKRTMLAGLLLGPVSVLLSSGISSKPRQLNAQAVAPAPSGANAAWTLKVKGDIRDRKSTRLNSSHGYISYAVFCLKKKKLKQTSPNRQPPSQPQPSHSSVT